MEDKKLNSQESLELIGRMIQNTQNNLQKNAGMSFILWGYVTLLSSLAVYIVYMITKDWRANLIWLAIPVVGLTLAFIVHRKAGTPPVRSFVDTAVGKLWIPLCIALLTFPFLSPEGPSIVLMLLGVGVLQTGLITKYRVFTISGALGLAAGLTLLFLKGPNQILVFAFFSAVVLVIPGHLLNRKAARNHVQRA